MRLRFAPSLVNPAGTWSYIEPRNGSHFSATEVEDLVGSIASIAPFYFKGHVLVTGEAGYKLFCHSSQVHSLYAKTR